MCYGIHYPVDRRTPGSLGLGRASSQRYIEKHVVTALSRMIIDGRLRAGTTVLRVTAVGGRLEFIVEQSPGQPGQAASHAASISRGGAGGTSAAATGRVVQQQDSNAAASTKSWDRDSRAAAKSSGSGRDARWNGIGVVRDDPSPHDDLDIDMEEEYDNDNALMGSGHLSSNPAARQKAHLSRPESGSAASRSGSSGGSITSMGRKESRASAGNKRPADSPRY